VLGGSPRRLGEGAGQAAAWSPDGQRMVYAEGPDLFLAKSDGSEPQKLVSAPDLVYYPAWSPGGKVIRFNIGAVGASTPSGALYQVSVDGTNLHPLVPDWHTPPQECCGQWTPERYFVFPSQGNIWALSEKGNILGNTNAQPVQLT
jgi:eukaryotic-like serine/threonine-protein kinase